MMTLSRTVMPLKIVVSWNVRTTPLRAAMWGASPEIRSPRSSTSPALGRRNDEISLNRVDLPAPFGPMTETISPSRTAKEMLSTATRPPKRLVMPEMVRRSAIRQLCRLATGKRLRRPFGRTSIMTIKRDEKMSNWYSPVWKRRSQPK